MLNLVCSPQTRKALHEKGLVTSPEEEKEVEALRVVATGLSGAINVLKHDKKRESQAAFDTMKSLAFGETVKKKRLPSSVSKLVSLNRWSISKCIKHTAEVLKGDEPSCLFTKRKPRVDSVKEEVKQTICQFWTFQASTPTGDKKHVVCKRIGPKQYLEHAKHVLEQTQSQAYFSFCAQHPGVVISQPKFEQLKPYFVKGARERGRRSCLCRKHEEARLVFNECVKFRKNMLKEAAHADTPPV